MTDTNSKDFVALRKYIELLESACGNSMAARMRYALSTELTDRQQQLVSMYYMQNMKQAEIARELGLSESSVSRTIKRGRMCLRRSLRYGGRALLDAMEVD